MTTRGADPEALLCVHHVLADHRSREVEVLGSRDEGARLDHLAKHLDAGQRVHLLSLRDRAVIMRANPTERRSSGHGSASTAVKRCMNETRMARQVTVE